MVYFTGDIHGFPWNVHKFCKKLKLGKQDILVLLGDVGANYYEDARDENVKAVLSELKPTILCVHGNHEIRPWRVKGYELQTCHGGKVWVQERYPNLLFAKDGEIFTLEGLRYIAIGGAYSVDMFTRFNTVMHPLYRGRSMSVSDVVVIDPEISADGVHDSFYSDQQSSASDNRNFDTDGTPSKEQIPIAKAGAYFCNAIGFTSITFDESQTHKPDNMLKVVYVEPNRKPFEAEILPDLKHLQQAVSGFIEPIYMDDGVIIVGNEEAKLQGMPGNRRLGKSILAGPLFICGEADEDFRSLTPEETEKYMDRFAEPEQISQQEVEADMGFTIISWF